MTQSGDSRAALLAAAALTRQWVRAQQAARSDELPTMATIAAKGRVAAPEQKKPQAPPAVDLRPAAVEPMPVPVSPPPAPLIPQPAVAPPTPPPLFEPVRAIPAPEVFPAPTIASEPVTGDPPPGPTSVPVFESPTVEEDVEPVPAGISEAKAWRRPQVSLAWLPKVAVAAGVLMALGAGAWTAAHFYSRQQALPKTGTALLESTPEAALVLVDGAQIGTTPLTQELEAGKHTVEFRRGKATRLYEIEIARGQQLVTRVDWDAKTFGGLQVDSAPAGAKVLLDGKDQGVTPLTLREITTGAHTLVLQSAEGSVRRAITIAEGQTLKVSEAIFSGFMHVSAPFEVQISEGQRVIQLDDRNQAMLSPGTHQIRFVNRALGYNQTKRVEVKPGEVAKVALEATLSTITVTSTVPGEVFIDGASVGQTPLTDHPVAAGTREIVVKTPDGERKATTTVQANQPATVTIDFAAP